MFDNKFDNSASTQQHRDEAPDSVGFAVLTVSDTRTKDDDSSGQLIREHLGFRGHQLKGYEIVPDEADQIKQHLDSWLSDPTINAIIVSGGTGISGRDVTYPIIESLIKKEMPGFGEIFRMLSWQEVGSASMLSRAMAGIHDDTVIFSLPGSSNAVRLALEKLIGPELGHVVHEIRKQA